jgi:hypothetical protein
VLATTLENLNGIEKSRKYLVDNFSKLTEKHRDEFVALVDGQLVFSDKSLDNLLFKVKGKFGSPNCALIDYIPSRHMHIVV